MSIACFTLMCQKREVHLDLGFENQEVKGEGVGFKNQNEIMLGKMMNST